VRLRHIAGAREQVNNHPLVVAEEQALAMAGSWQNCFAVKQPLVLEIGMGRGRFITALAKQQAGYNHIGLELREETILDALARVQDTACDNLRFLHARAEHLTTMFAPGEIERMYLLFSDPWPKKRHAKRRLTAPSFLALYQQILAPAGELIYKTDGEEFYDWSCEMFVEGGWHLQESSRDWPEQPREVISEYETRFRKKGQPIYYARYRP
jgi:tRNA (guanine-N7-)-methyltransferase